MDSDPTATRRRGTTLPDVSTLPSHHWQELSAPALDAICARDPIVMVPVGSTEQHGPHLPVGVDSIIAEELALRIAARINDAQPALVTPPLWAGIAEHHMAMGGTLTLGLSTLLALGGDLCGSLGRRGVRRIVLLNGHGGNDAALKALVDELGPTLSATVATVTYFDLAGPDMAPLLNHQSGLEHACEVETSLMLALRPDLVDMAAIGALPDLPPAPDTRLHRYRPIVDWTSTGAMGQPDTATPEKGRALLDLCVQTCTDAIMSKSLWGR